MNTVLILSYYFPPAPGVAGRRAYGLAKYLEIYGWHPVIVTARHTGQIHPDMEIIRTDYLDPVELKQFFMPSSKSSLGEVLSIKNTLGRNPLLFPLTLILDFVFYPDLQCFWRFRAMKSIDRICTEQKIDIVFTTSKPETAHIMGNRIKEKYHVPWVADLRDLWTQNHYYSHSSLRKKIETRLEHTTLQNADVLTTVSQPLADRLSVLHPDNTIVSIPNGFDPDEINDGSQEKSEILKIIYTGSLYRGSQDPEPLFRALRVLLSSSKVEKNSICIEFYGCQDSWLTSMITSYDLEEIVRCYPFIQRETVIQKQRGAHILLFLDWNDPAEPGIYTGKIFEYLAAKRPILSIGSSHGVIEQLLDTTNAGVQANTVDVIVAYLQDSLDELRKTRFVQYHGIGSEIEQYSQKQMARQFAGLFDSLLEKKRHRT